MIDDVQSSPEFWIIEAKGNDYKLLLIKYVNILNLNNVAVSNNNENYIRCYSLNLKQK